MTTLTAFKPFNATTLATAVNRKRSFDPLALTA